MKTVTIRDATRRAFGIGEFAHMFGVSRDTAKRLAKQGNLRTIRVGKRRLVPLSEVQRVEREGLGPEAK
jgi:excisionase family DNA binding protein